MPVWPRPSDGPDAEGLSNPDVMKALLDLGLQVRDACSLDELMFTMVNITQTLVPHQGAILIECRGTGMRIRAISGVTVVDRNAPFTLWMEHAGRYVRHSALASQLHPLSPESLPATLRYEWTEWMPENAFWIPLLGQDEGHKPRGILIITLSSSPDEEAQAVFANLQSLYTHALLRLAPRFGLRRSSAWLMKRRQLSFVGAVAFAACITIAFVPMQLSIIAPGEVVPNKPVVIRSPMDGVVASLHVSPNDRIEEDQVLMSLDRVDLRNRLDVAQRTSDIAAAQLEQQRKKAFLDARQGFDLGVLERVLERHKMEVAHLESLMEHTEIVAPTGGVVIMQDESEWVGRAVRLGERILMIADPADVAIDIRVPVSDMILLEHGAKVAFFLNVAPGMPVPASLARISYSAQVKRDGVLAYSLKTLPVSNVALRPGLKGLAKIYGRRSTIAGYLLRRPLAWARQWARVAMQ